MLAVTGRFWRRDLGFDGSGFGAEHTEASARVFWKYRECSGCCLNKARLPAEDSTSERGRCLAASAEVLCNGRFRCGREFRADAREGRGEHKANVNLNSTARALNQGRRDVIEGSGSWSDARRRGVEVAQRWRRNRLFGSLRERAWQPGIER